MAPFSRFLAGLALVLTAAWGARASGISLEGFEGTYWGHCFQYAYQREDGTWGCANRLLVVPQYVHFGRDATGGYTVGYHQVWNTSAGQGSFPPKTPVMEEVAGNAINTLPLTVQYGDALGYCIHVDLGSGATAEMRVNVRLQSGDFVYSEQGTGYLRPACETFSCPVFNASTDLTCEEDQNSYSYYCIARKLVLNATTTKGAKAQAKGSKKQAGHRLLLQR